MSWMLRICLILASLLTAGVILGKIRRSKVQIEDSIFWVCFSLVLLVFSVFPKLAYWLSDLIGIQSPANFIFMLVIFLLLVKIFSMSVRMSQLEAKHRELVQRIALDRTAFSGNEDKTDDTKTESETKS